ncbi:MAG: DUF4386 domain-containing protein [Thermoanaerobaculia bacterium]
MSAATVDASQRRAAKIIGLAYLLGMATAIFADVYVRGRLIVPDSAIETARNLLANETMWRLGIAGYLACMVSVAVLTAALYVVLERVDRSLAILATLLRVIEIAVGVVATLSSLEALRLLSGASYLQAFSTEQLQGLARLPISAYGTAINVSFVFLGCGSTAFSYLWLRSGYIPKPLAALGVIGSALLAIGAFAIVVLPQLAKTLSMLHMLPLGVFEVTLGFWLLIKGLREGISDGS